MNSGMDAAVVLNVSIADAFLSRDKLASQIAAILRIAFQLLKLILAFRVDSCKGRLDLFFGAPTGDQPFGIRSCYNSAASREGIPRE